MYIECCRWKQCAEVICNFSHIVRVTMSLLKGIFEGALILHSLWNLRAAPETRLFQWAWYKKSKPFASSCDFLFGVWITRLSFNSAHCLINQLNASAICGESVSISRPFTPSTSELNLGPVRKYLSGLQISLLLLSFLSKWLTVRTFVRTLSMSLLRCSHSVPSRSSLHLANSTMIVSFWQILGMSRFIAVSVILLQRVLTHCGLVDLKMGNF